MEPRKIYFSLLAKKLIQALQNRNIEGIYCETKQEALKKVLSILPSKSIISWSGSATLSEIGLLDAINKGDYVILDPNSVKGGVNMDKIAHQALTADYYLMSANALSITGEIVNLDGIGNRTSALIYGPKNVIIVAGINKVEQNLEAAILRAKTEAASLVVLHYSKGEITSYEELMEKAQKAVCQEVITSGSVFKGRIKLVLIGENLGY